MSLDEFALHERDFLGAFETKYAQLDNILHFCAAVCSESPLQKLIINLETGRENILQRAVSDFQLAFVHNFPFYPAGRRFVRMRSLKTSSAAARRRNTVFP